MLIAFCAAAGVEVVFRTYGVELVRLCWLVGNRARLTIPPPPLVDGCEICDRAGLLWKRLKFR